MRITCLHVAAVTCMQSRSGQAHLRACRPALLKLSNTARSSRPRLSLLTRECADSVRRLFALMLLFCRLSECSRLPPRL